MESIVTTAEQKPKPNFPVLRKSKRNDMVVLFESAKHGTVINQGTQKDYEVGHYSESWVEAYGNNWLDFNGSITLKN